MSNGPLPDWAIALRASAERACRQAAMHGDEAATVALEAIITGALSGSAGALGPRRCYDAAQPLVDVLAAAISPNVLKAKGRQK